MASPELPDIFSDFNFTSLMNKALSSIPDDVDKRQGSVIYDALAPACMLMTEMVYDKLLPLIRATFVTTSYGAWLDNRVYELGLTRGRATQAIRRVDCRSGDGTPFIGLPVGSRFASMQAQGVPTTYTITGPYEDIAGSYECKAEDAGSTGNSYFGAVASLDFVQGLASATLSTLITPAEDDETDAELIQRYVDTISFKPFAGNIAQYRAWVLGIDGVGAVQVYPVWDGGGTVKVSVVDADLNPISDDFAASILNYLDPETASGMGLGQVPVDHRVTVDTPQTVAVDVTATISLMPNLTIEQVHDAVELAIQRYIDKVRSTWGTPTDLNIHSQIIYVSQVIAAIQSVAHVMSVQSVTIGGVTDNLIFTEEAALQQIPQLGTVTLIGET